MFIQIIYKQDFLILDHFIPWCCNSFLTYKTSFLINRNEMKYNRIYNLGSPIFFSHCYRLWIEIQTLIIDSMRQYFFMYSHKRLLIFQFSLIIDCPYIRRMFKELYDYLFDPTIFIIFINYCGLFVIARFGPVLLSFTIPPQTLSSFFSSMKLRSLTLLRDIFYTWPHVITSNDENQRSRIPHVMSLFQRKQTPLQKKASLRNAIKYLYLS